MQLARLAAQQRLVLQKASRSFGTAAPASSLPGFTPAQLADMAVNGVRPTDIKPAKQYATLPRVEDVLVRVTLVDFKGDQYKVVGRIGDSLMQAAARYGHAVPLEDDSSGGGVTNQVMRSERWIEDVYGEGPSSWASHVVVSSEWYKKLPAPMSMEKEILELVDPDDLTPTSRLATEIILSKDLDGMTVYVPDPPPNDDVIQTYTL